MIEFWSGSRHDYEFPKNQLKWSYKMDTDLYEYAKMGTAPNSLKISPNGDSFATFGADRIIRIFSVVSGKLLKQIDESLKIYVDQGKENE